MEFLYIGIIIFLFCLAISDIIVGVSNDAVNFLNSAVGSKTAKFRNLIIIASIGVFLGASLSNGMMDIARHGIFQPQYFSFAEIVTICLAVMVTDVILLDAFNSRDTPRRIQLQGPAHLDHSLPRLRAARRYGGPRHDQEHPVRRRPDIRPEHLSSVW